MDEGEPEEADECAALDEPVNEAEEQHRENMGC